MCSLIHYDCFYNFNFMITQELLSYIKAEIAKGKQRDEIHQALVAGGGWTENDLSEAFKEIIPMPSIPPLPVKPITLPIEPMSPINPLMTDSAPTLIVSPPSSTPLTAQTFSPSIKSTPPQSSSHLFSRFLKFLIIFAIVGGLVYVGWFYKTPIKNLFLKQKQVKVKVNVPVEKTVEKTIENSVPQILGNKEDLVSFSILPGEKVFGVMNFTGSLRGAYFFEGNIGVNVLDMDKKIMQAGHGTATTPWMTTEPVSFETTLDFTLLPKGPAFIEISKDNPSDLRQYDKFIFIPVIID